MRIVLSATLVVAAVSAAAAATPPIQNPGAPGQSSRTLSAEESVAMSFSGHTAADVRFMQHMIVHHAQAVEMNALIAERSASAGVQRLGARIAASQTSEMDQMRRWLSERGEAVTDPALHTGHGSHAGHGDHHASMDHSGHDAAAAPGDTPLMPGMLSPNQMTRLAQARGDEFDRLFLEGMIRHHQGALDMVDALLSGTGNGQDPQLSELLTHVTADQAAEILRMRSMLSVHDAPGGDEEEALRP